MRPNSVEQFFFLLINLSHFSSLFWDNDSRRSAYDGISQTGLSEWPKHLMLDEEIRNGFCREADVSEKFKKMITFFPNLCLGFSKNKKTTETKSLRQLQQNCF